MDVKDLNLETGFMLIMSIKPLESLMSFSNFR